MDDGLLPVGYQVKYRLHCLTMLGFLDHWKDHYSPPVEFVDYLMDYDLDAAADCVRWVLEQPLREQVNPKKEMLASYCPLWLDQLTGYYWRSGSNIFADCHHSLFWGCNSKRFNGGYTFSCFGSAICWLFEQFEKHRPDLKVAV
jgi:hypothetical protein